MSKYLLFFQNNNKSNLIDSLPTRNLISTHTIANNDQFYSRIDIGRNDIYFMSSRNIASLKETGNSNLQIICYIFYKYTENNFIYGNMNIILPKNMTNELNQKTFSKAYIKEPC